MPLNLALACSVALAAMVIWWIYATFSLFRDLRNLYPAMHQEVGNPDPFNVSATFALLKFLFSRRPESLGNRKLLGKVRLMRVFAIASTLFFAALIAVLKYTEA
jgi:hypothetical protein